MKDLTLDRQYALDLAALDQLEATVKECPNYLTERYCKLEKRAISLRRDLRAGKVSVEKCRSDVFPLVDEINAVLRQIFQLESCQGWEPS